MDKSFNDTLEELQKRTAYDDLVVGCFLHNYGTPSRCGAFRNYGCKEAAKCKRLNGVLAKLYEEK